MTTNAVSLKPSPVSAMPANSSSINPAEGVAEALVFVDIEPEANRSWAYSATAEGRTGEVASAAPGSYDMDGEPGFIYSGPAGASVTVEYSDLDMAAGVVAPAAADQYTIGVFRNNDIQTQADEGWVAEFDAGTTEFNGNAVIQNMQPNDVVRLAIISKAGNTDANQLTVEELGVFSII